MEPIFYSHYSGKSLLTFDTVKDAEKYNKQSVLKISKENNIERPVVVDTKFTGVFELFQNAEQEGLSPIFGLNYKFVHDLLCKDSWHRIIIFIKNVKGYYDLIKIHNKANIENESYISPKILKEGWTENLSLAIPFYDSFLFRNSLYDTQCSPEFSDIPFTCFLESNSLPFDLLIADKVSKFENIRTKTVFYEKERDFKTWLTYRCALNFSIKGKQRSLENPSFEHCHSNKFSFESYLKER